ncbi:MAG: penicillin-binding protein 1C [Pseudomonadota bacterium]
MRLYWLCFFCVVFILDYWFPATLTTPSSSQVVVAKDKSILRAFPDSQGVWRYPITLKQVSPRYLEALINYEDRWFYFHPGVNPFSIVRAAYQNIRSGRIVSGGSTLTMQVARLRYPHSKDLLGKLKQTLRAIQLDWHYSKDEILQWYINHAPFGGTIEGVEAASQAFFGHRANDMTYAEAALLAVLPQAPSFYRPDRHPQRAQQARDKLLSRLKTFEVWNDVTIHEAQQEIVEVFHLEQPILAPLLARRLSQTFPSKSTIETTINSELQVGVQSRVKDYIARFPVHCSAAVLVVDNVTNEVQAYVGSADFKNAKRFGHVDMVTAWRSPGSTLKPWIYGLAMDEGFIHSESLLMDVPLNFGDYHPENFHQNFSGAVSVSESLKKSLNVPVVQVLSHLGSQWFYTALINANIQLKLPYGAYPNLSMALGGIATQLEELVKSYSSLANQGQVHSLKYLVNTENDSRTLLSPEGAWIIQNILKEPQASALVSRENLAIKTGTSFGYRDSWALGVNKKYTIGVWVGRPDGTPMPGFYGASTAVPLLKTIHQLLPFQNEVISKPSSLTQQIICWPSGRAQDQPCDIKKAAWLVKGMQPRTLAASPQTDGWVFSKRFRVSHDKKLRVPLGCEIEGSLQEHVLWPKELDNWIAPRFRVPSALPKIDPRCPKQSQYTSIQGVKIRGLSNGDKLRVNAVSKNYPRIRLKVMGGVDNWYWFINGVLQKEQGANLNFLPDKPGSYQIVVIDQSGSNDKITISVEN